MRPAPASAQGQARGPAPRPGPGRSPAALRGVLAAAGVRGPRGSPRTAPVTWDSDGPLAQVTGTEQGSPPAVRTPLLAVAGPGPSGAAQAPQGGPSRSTQDSAYNPRNQKVPHRDQARETLAGDIQRGAHLQSPEAPRHRRTVRRQAGGGRRAAHLRRETTSGWAPEGAGRARSPPAWGRGLWPRLRAQPPWGRAAASAERKRRWRGSAQPQGPFRFDAGELGSPHGRARLEGPPGLVFSFSK